MPPGGTAAARGSSSKQPPGPKAQEFLLCVAMASGGGRRRRGLSAAASALALTAQSRESIDSSEVAVPVPASSGAPGQQLVPYHDSAAAAAAAAASIDDSSQELQMTCCICGRSPQDPSDQEEHADEELTPWYRFRIENGERTPVGEHCLECYNTTVAAFVWMCTGSDDQGSEVDITKVINLCKVDDAFQRAFVVCNRVRVTQASLPYRKAKVDTMQKVGWRLEQPLKCWTEQSFFAAHKVGSHPNHRGPIWGNTHLRPCQGDHVEDSCAYQNSFISQGPRPQGALLVLFWFRVWSTNFGGGRGAVAPLPTEPPPSPLPPSFDMGPQSFSSRGPGSC